MLVFCEDCGAKNIVETERQDSKTSQYRCSNCNFLNSYTPKNQPSLEQTKGPGKTDQTLNSPSDSTPQKRHKKNIHQQPYERVFNNISKNDSIHGAFIYHFSDGLLVYETDASLEESTMMQIGKAFSVCGPFSHKILDKTKEIYLVLDNMTAVCRNITVNSILVIICNHYPVTNQEAKVFDQAVNSLQVFI